MTHQTHRNPWHCALELSSSRKIIAGSNADLAAAISRGADLRVYTEFTHEEHVAPFGSPAAQDPAFNGLYREIIDFRVAYLLNNAQVAGITTLRQPLEPSTGFNGTQPKMSFFLYNMDGRQACAQIVLDNSPAAPPGNNAIEPVPPQMPKLRDTTAFDLGSHAPSRNFIYDMEIYRYFVCDNWTPILSHDEHGNVLSGSPDAIGEAQSQGRELKVALANLCCDLPGAAPGKHEVFSLLGSSFYHTKLKTFESLTHPLVRVAPSPAGAPLAYASQNWDVAWVSVNTTGKCTVRKLNPVTRTFSDHPTRLALRWFVR
jgi:hypothetical protein